jgi:predicted Holliday junction resolvase-like endonuclease
MTQLEIALIACIAFLVIIVATLFYFYFTLKLQVPVLINVEQEKWQKHFKKLDEEWRTKQDDWQQRVQKSNDEFREKMVQIQHEAIQQAEKLFLDRRDEERKMLFQAAETYATRVLTDKEKEIRGDAINRSHSVIMGKVSEHFIPFIPQTGSNLNPKEFRFIGNPIDFVVFRGLYDEKAEIDVFFVEVKTGTSKLSPKQVRIRQAVEEKRVYWETVNPNDSQTSFDF